MKKLYKLILIFAITVYSCSLSAIDTSALDTNALERIIDIYNSTAQGRVQLHGAIQTQNVDAANHVMITIYADGYQHTNTLARAKPQTYTRPAYTEEQLKQNVGPKRYREIQKKREEYSARTNMLTIVYGPGYENLPPVRSKMVLSKMKLVMACREMGIWNDVKQWLIDNDLYDVYLAAQVVDTDNEIFLQGVSAFMQSNSIPRQAVWDIFEKCKAE